jgi:NADH-quinone oxidoreductase subunit H
MDVFLIALLKSAIVVAMLLGGFAYMTLWERKLVGRIQLRYGPNRTGPFGLLQPVADGIKLMFKEPTMPMGADRWVYPLAPAVSVIAALSSYAVIPLGPDINVFGRVIPLHLADVDIGILWMLAMSSLGVYGIVLAGWSSNNKYSLLGGVRSSAQMISYELSLGLSLVGVLLLAGSLRLTTIVDAQSAVPFIVYQPLGFVLYCIAAVAEVNRAPFDLPEADTELVAGYHTEYNGLKFALFQMSEYINMITVCSIATTLFLGGWHGPFLSGPWWFVAKVFVLLSVFIWVRATLPRLRYDRLMNLGWRVLMPLALLNVALTATAVVVFKL